MHLYDSLYESICIYIHLMHIMDPNKATGKSFSFESSQSTHEIMIDDFKSSQHKFKHFHFFLNFQTNFWTIPSWTHLFCRSIPVTQTHWHVVGALYPLKSPQTSSSTWIFSPSFWEENLEKIFGYSWYLLHFIHFHTLLLTSWYLKSLGLDLSNLMLLYLLSVFSTAALSLNLSAGLIWGKQAICLEHLLTTTQKSQPKLSADFAFSSPHEFLVDFVDLFFCGSFLQIPFWFSKIYTLFSRVPHTSQHQNQHSPQRHVIVHSASVVPRSSCWPCLQHGWPGWSCRCGLIRSLYNWVV